MIAGTPFGLSVMAIDSSGALATDFAGEVTIALGYNTGGLTLSGSTSAFAFSGIAEFSKLQIDRGAITISLFAQGTGLSTAETATFNVLGYSPAQIRQAYGFNGLNLTGSGETIAIVVPYDDPFILPTSDLNYSSSDLAIFDKTFGLPEPGAGLFKFNQTGSNSGLPGLGPKPGYWQAEAALDVEWAHAIAPGAAIDVIETNSDSPADIAQGVKTAASLEGVTVVSLSIGFFAGSEDSTETTFDSAFATPFGHGGVTFVACSGDNGGASPWYPAMSANVVAVGGTGLSLAADNSYAGEVAWPKSGGGVSQFEPEPDYQFGVQSSGKRISPDVAFDADGATGVPFYDGFSSSVPARAWSIASGTSIGAPCWAGLFALVDQARALQNKPSLDGPSQTLPALYALPGSDFNDITSGSNGPWSARAGYDYVTGLGTPRANFLVPGLAGYTASSTGPPPTHSYHLEVMSGLSKTSIGAGTPVNVVADVLDESGHIVTSFNGIVTVSLVRGPRNATILGVTSVRASGGVAALRGLSIIVAGTGYVASVSSPGMASVVSPKFTVTPGRTAQFRLISPPPLTVAAGRAFGARLQAVDQYGNATPKFVGSVSVALQNNPAGGKLKGRLSVKAIRGIAAFRGLKLTLAAKGYTLQFRSKGLRTLVSGSVDVN